LFWFWLDKQNTIRELRYFRTAGLTQRMKWLMGWDCDECLETESNIVLAKQKVIHCHTQETPLHISGTSLRFAPASVNHEIATLTRFRSGSTITRQVNNVSQSTPTNLFTRAMQQVCIKQDKLKNLNLCSFIERGHTRSVYPIRYLVEMSYLETQIDDNKKVLFPIRPVRGATTN